MLRIAHISDLHIRHPEMNNDDLSLLQRVAKAIGQTIGLDVQAGGHSDEKLEALNSVLGLLRPDVILVTGDITNFGDRASFQMAHTYLEKLKQTTGAKNVYCVPGNHDCLCERAAEVQLSRKGSTLLRALSIVNREVDLMTRPEPGLLRDQPDDDGGMTLLKNYKEWIVDRGYGEVNPGKPILLDAQWGSVALFLFNAVNDPGLMANKGRIGSKQFNTLNLCLQSPDEINKCRNAVRIALLHHHPISAPQSLDQDINRLYDWMQDGPLFLQYLNHHGFHFILHGHQHEPFRCTIDYEHGPGAGLHIVAAGSASQGQTEPHKNSFNLIDLLTPFEARFCRYEYSSTGYSEEPVLDVLLPVRPIEEVRVTQLEEPTVEDWAMQELIKGSYRQAYDVDSEHEYSLLEYRVEVTREQLYKAQYRRAGKVVGDKDSDGPVFIVTGSPAMKVKHMALAARDNVKNEELAYDVLRDRANRKVIRVLPRLQMKPGDQFDVTLSFQWQATESEPNDFDGINLMTFRNPVGCLSYSATLAWNPAQARVLAYGVEDIVPELQDVLLEPGTLLGTFKYSFNMDKPKPMAYLISFRPSRTED